MKKLMKKAVIMIVAIATLATSTIFASVPAMAAEKPAAAVNEAPAIGGVADALIITAKITAFSLDSRWKNGVSWPQRSPKLSTHSSKGCCAYAADFCKYVYGYNWMTATSKFKKYTDLNNIKTGDIIHTSNHWFVVLRRDGNKLYTAEGAYSSKTRVSTSKPGYYIENGKLYQCWYNNSTTKLKYSVMTFAYGYHYN